MANILGVTNPVPGHDSTNVNRNLPISHNDTTIQNIPDPTRVGRPDARTDQQDSSDMTGQQLRYDSNFQTFLQRLNNTPDLMKVLSRILMGQKTIVSSGLTEGMAEKIAQLMEMLPMNEGELVSFLKEQVQSGSRFSGTLFSVLRGIYFSELSEGLRMDILQFAKRYSDFSSAKHIEGNLLRSLRGMTNAMPASWANRLIELSDQLKSGIAAGDRAGNLKLIQGQIFPYMSKYIERTHDMGIARAFLTMFTLDTARYESGTEQGMLQAFHQLMANPSLQDKLGGLDDKTLLYFLKETEFARASEGNRFATQLAETAAHALRGEGGNEMQSGFREILSALLINESVYMPINHYMLPLQWDGKMAFSELWVDPDADRDSNNKSGENTRTLRFLFKLDIQGLGMFDIVLANRAEQVDMQIFCPEKVALFSHKMESELTKILTNNGLIPGTIQVSRIEKPLTISQVFPKLFERKNSVNVKI